MPIIDLRSVESERQLAEKSPGGVPKTQAHPCSQLGSASEWTSDGLLTPSIYSTKMLDIWFLDWANCKLPHEAEMKGSGQV